MPEFAGFDFGSVLEGLRPVDDDGMVVVHALEETLQGLLTFLPIHVPDSTPLMRYAFRILGCVGRDFHLVSVDGTPRRFGRHAADLPASAIDYALRLLPDTGRPPPDTAKRFLDDHRLGTFAALFVGQSAADNMRIAVAHHPIMASAHATGFLKDYLAADRAKSLRFN